MQPSEVIIAKILFSERITNAPQTHHHHHRRLPIFYVPNRPVPCIVKRISLLLLNYLAHSHSARPWLGTQCNRIARCTSPNTHTNILYTNTTQTSISSSFVLCKSALCVYIHILRYRRTCSSSGPPSPFSYCANVKLFAECINPSVFLCCSSQIFLQIEIANIGINLCLYCYYHTTRKPILTQMRMNPPMAQ